MLAGAEKSVCGETLDAAGTTGSEDAAGTADSGTHRKDEHCPLHDAAAVNITRWALDHRLEATRVPVETGTGGRTKWSRTQRGLEKTHGSDH
jgi:hypothetical protein